MGKRFTETDKWSDPWFRRLSAEHKLAWLYLLDNCDLAGVVDLDHDLADFQIGCDVDWDGFVMGVGSDRVEVLPNGKLFVLRFIEFQHGTLSVNCKAHGPAFRSIEKNGLSQRVSKGYPKGMDTLKVKVKVKVKEKVKVMDLPAVLDNPEFREALSQWLDYHKPYKPAGLKALITRAETRASESGLPALLMAFTKAMSNGWTGWDQESSFTDNNKADHDPRGNLALLESMRKGTA